MAVRGAGLRPSRRRAWAASPHGEAWTATPGVRTIVCKVLENVPRGQQVDAVDVDRLRAARHSGRGVATFLKQVWGRGRRRRRTWRQRGVPAAGVFFLYYPFGFMGLGADLGRGRHKCGTGAFPTLPAAVAAVAAPAALSPQSAVPAVQQTLPSLTHFHQTRLILGLVLHAKPLRPCPLLFLVLAGLQGSSRSAAAPGS